MRDQPLQSAAVVERSRSQLRQDTDDLEGPEFGVSTQPRKVVHATGEGHISYGVKRRMTAFCPPRAKNKPHRVTRPSLRTAEQSHNYSTSTTSPRRTHTSSARGGPSVRPTIEEPINNTFTAPGRSRPGTQGLISSSRSVSQPLPSPGVRGQEGSIDVAEGRGRERQARDGLCRRSAALLWRRVAALPQKEGVLSGDFLPKRR